MMINLFVSYSTNIAVNIWNVNHQQNADMNGASETSHAPDLGDFYDDLDEIEPETNEVDSEPQSQSQSSKAVRKYFHIKRFLSYHLCRKSIYIYRLLYTLSVVENDSEYCLRRLVWRVIFCSWNM